MGVLRAPEGVRRASLSALAPAIAGRESDQIDGVQRVPDGIQLVGSNDCFDFIHGINFHLLLGSRPG